MIDDYTFGKMVIDGAPYQTDLKIVSGRVVPDWWRKQGHRLAVEDVADILAARPEVLVVGKGSPGQMEVTRALKEALQELHIELREQPTAEAMAAYNQLAAEGRKVAAAFHLTC